MKVISGISTLRQHIRAFRRSVSDPCVAFVPTMGALHEGHLELVRQARTQHNDSQNDGVASLVIVSIFVNPLQFGANEDFGRYPRTLDADLAKLATLADCVFCPDARELIGAEGEDAQGVRISAGRIGKLLEGRTRPRYHDGVLNIVAKLFNIVQPDVALFGKKDAQQLFAICQMVRALHFPVRIVPVDTWREPDGLAMSSRNAYLGAEERQQSLCLHNSLQACTRGATLAEAMANARKIFEKADSDMVKLDYLVVVDPETFVELEGNKLEQFRGRALILVAAFVGSTRLIDNMELEFQK